MPVLHCNPKSHTAEVLAHCDIQTLEEACLQVHPDTPFTLACGRDAYPPGLSLRHIIAYNIPARYPTQARFRYPSRWLLGAEVYIPSISLSTPCKLGAAVLKNVTGYDLLKLWPGSLEAFGKAHAFTLRLESAVDPPLVSALLPEEHWHPLAVLRTPESLLWQCHNTQQEEAIASAWFPQESIYRSWHWMEHKTLWVETSVDALPLWERRRYHEEKPPKLLDACPTLLHTQATAIHAYVLHYERVRHGAALSASRQTLYRQLKTLLDPEARQPLSPLLPMASYTI
ncbi:MAG: hypothetical protein ACKO37_07375 [Vampirovibrionales bacterium]